MKSPKSDSILKTILTENNVYVDYCPRSKGVWLDRGEIYLLKANQNQHIRALKKGLINLRSTDFNCPRCQNEKLEQGEISGTLIVIEQCPKCEGLWFDAGEIKKVIGRSITAKKPKPSSLKAGVQPLASLGLASLFTIGSLVGMLVGFLMVLEQLGYVSSNAVTFVPLLFLIVQFIVSPWVMDLSLKWLGSMHWIEFAQLPTSTQKLVKEICGQKNTPVPRFGVIQDGAPNAFTYGRTPYDARVVVTQGTLDLLEEEEFDAVVAHEMGHVVHWDFVIMTMAQSIPIVLYQIYNQLSRLKKKGDNDKATQLVYVGIAAYLLYQISEFLVLYLSRIREYWADRFSAQVTKNPNALSSALIKIAYGLNRQEKNSKKHSDSEKSNYLQKSKAVQAMGISSVQGSQDIAFYAAQSGEYEDLNLDKEVMKWDMWNPWAQFYELQSTHPLTAKRIISLSLLAKSYNQEPLVEFDLVKPESYWDEFSVDLFFKYIPFIIPIAIAVYISLTTGLESRDDMIRILPVLFFTYGIGYAVYLLFSYPGKKTIKAAISSLLRVVKVSSVRGIPVRLKGRVIGRGIPGYLLSEDFVLKDETGIIYLDYRQPLALFEFIFAIFRSNKYSGQEVEVEGWYRRGPTPYIEVKRIVAPKVGLKTTSRVLTFKWIWAILCICIALYIRTKL